MDAQKYKICKILKMRRKNIKSAKLIFLLFYIVQKEDA